LALFRSGYFSRLAASRAITARGRLVAVVSQIKAVAERRDGAAGDEDSWGHAVALVKGTEHQELMDGELEAGLLT